MSSLIFASEIPRMSRLNLEPKIQMIPICTEIGPQEAQFMAEVGPGVSIREIGLKKIEEKGL